MCPRGGGGLVQCVRATISVCTENGRGLSCPLLTLVASSANTGKLTGGRDGLVHCAGAYH